MNTPKISVITINYNGDTHLEKTIESICNQNYDNFEYIVIDGASTDKSLSIIEKYSKIITKFSSEPDKGIADAMNKGFAFSTGDYLVFIHSDDYLLSDDTLSKAAEWLDKEHDIFAYGIRYGNDTSSRSIYPRGFSYWMNFKVGLFHQGVLCHRNVFNKIGCFDTDFKIVMDYDFFLRAYKQKISLKCCKYPLAFMRDTGISSQQDQSSLSSRFDEEHKVHLKNCRTAFLKYIYTLYWALYRTYRSFK